MSEASVTVTGYVGTTPELHLSANQVPWTSFRVASTRRVRDPRSGEWRDGATTWFTVKAFRAAARTLAESLVQGQPVVVTGRLSTEEWVDRDGRDRFALVVEAEAAGPDATRGLTRFARVKVDTVPGGAGSDGAGSGAGHDEDAAAAPGSTASGEDDPWSAQASGPVDPWADGVPEGPSGTRTGTASDDGAGLGDDTVRDGELVDA